jgi:cytochrome c biogenesis protein CcmG/thiol:disulfide interchange protein DsbE
MSEITSGPPAKKRTLSVGTILIFVAVVAVLGMLGWGLLETNKTQPVVGEKVRKFQMSFFNGYEWQDKTIADINDMAGNVIVLNFWASWCVQCRDETALFEQAWREYQDDGVIFVGVAYVDVEPKSIEYMQQFEVTFPNAPDLRSAISDLYKITGVPETYIIDQEGNVVFTKEGAVTETELYTQLAALTGKNYSMR